MATLRKDLGMKPPRFYLLPAVKTLTRGSHIRKVAATLSISLCHISSEHQHGQPSVRFKGVGTLEMSAAASAACCKSTLFTLPREVRDMIYDNLLTARDTTDDDSKGSGRLDIL